jgi:penicillin amidase
MKKRRFGITSVIGVFLSAILLQVYGAPAQSALLLDGCRGTVTIRRDRRGIPYITATNADDLYFAQGYTVAGDRLWEMDLLRRTGRGELSEIFGTRTLEEDKRRRAYGYAALADQTLERLSPPVRASVEAYARGVNAFIKSLDKASLPPEFGVLQYEPRPWSASDSLIIGKVFAESLTTTWQTDLLRAALADLPAQRRDAILPSVSPLDLVLVGNDRMIKRAEASISSTGHRQGKAELVAVLGEASEGISAMRRSLERVGLYAEELAASNNWVISGRRSVTGKPLLANDPHLVPSAPSMWYMVELRAPGLHVAGVTVPGAPGVFIGHNEHIAWGSTNVAADVQDLYVEKFDKNNPRRYATPTGWREADVRREQIKVRKGLADPATDTFEFDVTVTRHGPIILKKDEAQYALAWPALDVTTNEFEVYYFLNRARNWQEFCAALSNYTGFPLNFVYADAKGHIGYWAAGRYPIRKSGRGIVPYDGAATDGDWTGYIPFELTPHLYDPPSGIIVTANNRIVGSDYPYHITDEWAAPYRARRIYNLLTAKPKLSVEDFRAIQADTYSYSDGLFMAEVSKLGRRLAGGSAEWREMLAAFDAGDATMRADSRLTPLSFSMRASFQRRILTAAIGAELMQKFSWASIGTFFDRIITMRPREWLPKEFDSYEALLLVCYKDAVETLTKKIGPDRAQWEWGRLTQARFPHPLANAPLFGQRFTIAPVPQNGGPQTVNRGASVSMRFIADVGNWDNTRQGLALGQSGNPASPHWKDQLTDWQAVTPATFPFTASAVAGAATKVLTITAPPRNESH